MMSLIQIRGHTILPPVVKETFDVITDDRTEEEDKILSMSPQDALKYVLCGLSVGSFNKSSDAEEGQLKNVTFEDACKKNGIQQKNGSNDTYLTEKSLSNYYKKSILNNNNSSHISLIKCKNLNKEIIPASASIQRSVIDEYDPDSEICDLEENDLGSHRDGDESYKSPLNEQLSSSTPSDKNSLSSVSNHQKLKILKFSASDSSSYLQDYLQLLTSRSHFMKVGKVKREPDSLERRGSTPTCKSTASSPRQRNSSGNSDKSESSRSLGSTYLDSYLGNLTDHSWIIYPMKEKAVSDVSKSEVDKSNTTVCSLNSDDDNLQRRLRFLNPDKFFNPTKTQIEVNEDPSHSSSVMKSSSSVENEKGLTDTSGVVVSPDNSVSSLDTDQVEISHPSSRNCFTNNNENFKRKVQNQVSFNKDSQLHRVESLQVNNSATEKKHSSELNGLNKDSPAIGLSVDSSPNDKDNKDSSPSGKENHIQEEGSDTSVSSELSTDDEAEEQVSMIVCDTQKQSNDIENQKKQNDQPQTLSPTAPEKSSLPERKEKTVQRSSETEGLAGKLIKMLKMKQEEEVKELKKKHEKELSNFIYELSQLSTAQKISLLNSYESSNNNIHHDILNFSANVDASISQTSVSSELSNHSNDSLQEPFTASFNHTNLMPSFFLHREKQENNVMRPDVNKISQIFSPSKSSIQPTHSKLLPCNSSLIQTESRQDTSSKCPLQKNSDNVKQRKQPFFSQRQFEVGLDLVPTRESDGTAYSSLQNHKQRRGICKLQAIVKGTRIRKLMCTSKVQQLLATLKEVSKLAHQFHQDILMDNIRKGDINFHKALFNEERQAREKLINIMVEMSPAEQLHIIKKDRIADERENQRRTVERPKVTSNRVLGSGSPTACGGNVLMESNKNASSALSEGSPSKIAIKQIPKKLFFSELPRPCKTPQSSETKYVGRLPSSSSSPRGKQQSFVPSQKSLVSKNISKHRIVKKIDSLPQTHVPSKRHNTPICKSDAGYLSKAGPKTNKTERNPNSIQGNVISTRKPWR